MRVEKAESAHKSAVGVDTAGAVVRGPARRIALFSRYLSRQTRLFPVSHYPVRPFQPPIDLRPFQPVPASSTVLRVAHKGPAKTSKNRITRIDYTADPGVTHTYSLSLFVTFLPLLVLSHFSSTCVFVCAYFTDLYTNRNRPLSVHYGPRVPGPNLDLKNIITCTLLFCGKNRTKKKSVYFFRELLFFYASIPSHCTYSVSAFHCYKRKKLAARILFLTKQVTKKKR